MVLAEQHDEWSSSAAVSPESLAKARLEVIDVQGLRT